MSLPTLQAPPHSLRYNFGAVQTPACALAPAPASPSSSVTLEIPDPSSPASSGDGGMSDPAPDAQKGGVKDIIGRVEQRAKLEAADFGEKDTKPNALRLEKADGNKDGIVVSAETLVGGFLESLVSQRRRHLEKKGERLTVMCIGEAGSGKTTLSQSLFVQEIPRRTAGTKSTVEIEELMCDVVMGQGEGTVRVSLKIVDSPGYGDDLDVVNSFKRVTDYIEGQFDKVLEAEKRIHRPGYEELNASCGVDAVLYFIAPHRLKKLDIEFLKRIHKLASVLPILSKADTMTVQELNAFRSEVKEGLDKAGVETFAGPFAVICCAVSSNEGEVNYSRGRSYPWGTAMSDDPEHSDLPLLRQTLLTDGLMDLHEARSRKFEAYRREKALKLRRRKRSILGSLGRLQRWALGIAVHTVIGIAVFKGVQMKLESMESEEKDVGSSLARERGRGFFGRKEQKEEEEAVKGKLGLWGR